MKIWDMFVRTCSPKGHVLPGTHTYQRAQIIEYIMRFEIKKL